MIDNNLSTLKGIIDSLKELNTTIVKPKKTKIVPLNRLRRRSRTDTGKRRTPLPRKDQREAPGFYRQQERYWQGIRGTYQHLKKTYRSRAKIRKSKFLPENPGDLFELSYDDWFSLWNEAGFIQTTTGLTVRAFELRGKYKGDARLMRIEHDKPWRLDNMVIVYDHGVIASGPALSTSIK